VSVRSDLRRYRRLLGYAAPYRRGWALIVGLSLVGSAFSILQPWPMQVLVDHVLGHHPLSPALARAVRWLPGGPSPQALLAAVVLAGLALFAVSSAIDGIVTLAYIRAGQRMVYDLAGDVFAHIQRRSLLFHHRVPVGDSLGRITTDSWCVHNMVSTILFGPATALVTLAMMLTVLFRMDAGLAAVALCVGPLAIAARALFRGRVRAAVRARREVESRIQSHVQQTLSGVSVVQAFAQEDRSRRGFVEIASAIAEAQGRAILVRAGSRLGPGLLMTAGMALVLFVGAHRVLSGRISVGSLLVFLAYLKTLQSQMGSVTNGLGALQGTSAGVERVMEILEAEPEVKDRPGAAVLGPVRGEVALEGVTFGYDGGRPVLRGISLVARPGETVAIVGATGAGKSTLVGLIPRFFDPWEGRVTIDGRDVREVQLKGLRGQVSIVLQEPFLFPTTIAGNIAYGRPEASPEEVEGAARAANAHAFIERLPRGYETVVGERGATLSGGERQRLSIARALLKDAPILILDEPTSALDAETEEALLLALRRLVAGRTTFVIAHRLSTIRGADQILVLDEGRIVDRGTHDELLAGENRYSRFHALQRAAAAGERTMGSAERA